MPNLFIIGNGFDLAHQLPTSYEDFHQFLLHEHPNMSWFPWMSGIIIGHHGEEFIDPDAAISLMCYLIDDTKGDNWSNLEQTLGELDLSLCFDMSLDPSECTDREGDVNWAWVWENRRECCQHLSLSVEYLYEKFEEWIEYVEAEFSAKIQPGFQQLISPKQDLFLTFNYTKTLENIYNCSCVCHIHGKIGENLMLGHGGPTRCLSFDEDSDDQYDMELGLQEVYESMRKNTDEAIEKHTDFFEQLARLEIDNIYSYGFSFSPVDEPYIKKICSMIPTKEISWYFHDYCIEEHETEFINTIRRCGFNGKVNTFCV